MQLEVGCLKNSLSNVGDKPNQEKRLQLSIWFPHIILRLQRDDILLINLSNKRSIYMRNMKWK